LFVLALASSIAGLAGLVAQQKQRAFHPPDEDSTEPRVYRHKEFRLDKSMLDKLAQAARSVRQRVEEMECEADMADYDEHYGKADKEAKSGDLPEAFREYCRAIRPISAALRKHRPRDAG
jgi:hypothetical protein